jgi:hypothetical protein
MKAEGLGLDHDFSSADGKLGLHRPCTVMEQALNRGGDMRSHEVQIYYVRK